MARKEIARYVAIVGGGLLARKNGIGVVVAAMVPSFGMLI